MKQLNPLEVSRIFRKTQLLKSVPEEDLLKLSEGVRHQRFRTGQIIFAKNARDTPIYFVVDGRVKITSPGRGGNELLLGVIEPGEMFGELSLVDDGPRSVSAVAERASYVIGVARLDLLPVVEGNPQSAMAFSRPTLLAYS